MGKEALLEILNQSIAREIAVTIQYMWHHVTAIGLESAEVEEIFKKVAIEEMKHAEKFAERLDYLGGVPTTKPSPIVTGGSVEKMLKDNLKAEEEAIALYKKAIQICIENNDPVSRLLYEEILSDEEDHHNTFGTLLGK
ncbi:MAG: ferritin-like domain-containing protein [Candidatus Bathyarchaeota archaeon]|jgi:bacterioferritin|nr:ferritin-like domain-containing protein [Candidatus Bathyarchaeota archaeon]